MKNKVKSKNQRKRLHLNKKKSFKELKTIRRKIVNKIKVSQKMNNKMVIQKVRKENQIIKIKEINKTKTKIKIKIMETTKKLPQNNKRASANRKEKQTNFKKNER